jgi:hypothetical protein
MTHWISVKDRLPLEEGTYLVVTKRDENPLNITIEIADCIERWQTIWDSLDRVLQYLDKTPSFSDEVTHWMPLPELPTKSVDIGSQLVDDAETINIP